MSSTSSSGVDATSWSQRNSHTYTAPTPPRWRFVNDAKKTSGYSSMAAGNYIPGKSSQELAAHYSAPTFHDAVDGTNDKLNVGKLRQRDITKSGDKGLVEVGKLDIEEAMDNKEKKIVGTVKRLSRRWDSVPATLEVMEQEVKKEKKEQQVVESVIVQEMSMEGKKVWCQQQEEAAEEEEELSTTSIPQIEELQQESIIEVATVDTKEQQDEQSDVVTVDNGVDEEEEPPEEEQPPKEEDIVPVPAPQEKEEASTQPIIETSISDEKQPTPPHRKRRCLLLLLLALLIIVGTIIGIVFGTSLTSSKDDDQNVFAMQPPLVNVSSEQGPPLVNDVSSETDVTTQYRCPAKEKYVSIRQHMQQSSSSRNGTNARARRIEATSTHVDATWSIKDSCSGEVLMKCEPCLFSDEGDIAFEFIEKTKRIGSPSLVNENVNIISDFCVPDSHEYLFEVRKTDGTAEDRCCNFDVTTFFVTVDDVTVIDSTHTIIDIDSGVVSTSFGSAEESGPCPTDSPSPSPSVFPTLSVPPTMVLPFCQFCPYCRWRFTNFNCQQREEYMVSTHKLSWEEAPIAIMNSGQCIDYWCDDCLWSSANDTSSSSSSSSSTTTCREMLDFTLSNDTNANEGTFKWDTMESGLCKQVSNCTVERYIHPPSISPSSGQTDDEAQCIAAGEDLNLCIAIDLSGSLCNRGTGYKCEGCIPENICNNDGVDLITCCGNFHNVKEFAKLLIFVFGSIPSEQSYSVVGFATNTSFVSNLASNYANAFSSLDSLAYTGGVTNHAAAISSCQQTLSNPDTVQRKNVIILITDGNPTEPEDTAKEDAMAAAIQVKEAGSILIPVMLTRTSIDNSTIDYMTELSSDGLFFNTSLSGLDSLEESILSEVMC